MMCVNFNRKCVQASDQFPCSALQIIAARQLKFVPYCTGWCFDFSCWFYFNVSQMDAVYIHTKIKRAKKRGKTDITFFRPVGLANTLYKLWTSMVTNTLYAYAEANCLLSTSQAGFRKHKYTIHLLQNIIMALEDAKLLNTTCTH